VTLLPNVSLIGVLNLIALLRFRCSYLSIATMMQKQKAQDDDEDMRMLAEWAL